jgi:hypothetical protein
MKTETTNILDIASAVSKKPKMLKLPWLILLRQKTMELPIIWAVLCDHGFGVDEWPLSLKRI